MSNKFKKLFFIDNMDQMDPAVNLAIEEFSVRNLSIENDYFFVYRNNPSVIVGRHQNIFEEVDQKYARLTKTPVFRRISGGGTVYHDPGNINFTYITRHTFEKFNNYRMFITPVIRSLKELSVPAVLNNRNDIMVENKKVSGNAQFTSRDRMMSHGTLLFDTDLARLRKALKKTDGEIESKSTKSVRSSVTNIREYFSQKIDINTFTRLLINNVSSEWHDFSIYKFDDAQWDEIYQLARNKYDSWDWNYGQSPKFKIKKCDYISGTQIKAELEILNGIIHSCLLISSADQMTDMNELGQLFNGHRYYYDDIWHLLSGVDLKHYFKNVTNIEFINLLC